MPAPTMLYVMPENFTPAHRAQLVKSNKKLEQILGVTPSVVPLQPNPSHRRARSSAINHHGHSTRGRERGKLSTLFSKADYRSSTDSAVVPLTRNNSSHRLSAESIASTSFDDLQYQHATSSSSSVDLTAKRLRPRHRPPMLNLVNPNGKSENLQVIDITKPAVSEHINVETPLSPLFHLDLPNVGRARRHQVEEDEDEILGDIMNRPIDKKTKLSRLARHFGTQPPLELVFPPSPTSQSRNDPRRYTYALPPPLTRGAEPELKIVEEEPSMVERKSTEKALQVYWDAVNDEQGRQKVMDVLRSLK